MVRLNPSEHIGLITQIIQRHGIFFDHKLFEDLQQEGLIAVCKASKTYDKRKGGLANHLYWHIRSAIQHYIAKNSMQLSYGTYETLLKQQHPETSLQKRYCRKDTSNIGEFLDYCRTDTKTAPDIIDDMAEQLREKKLLTKLNRAIKKLPRSEQRLLKILCFKKDFYYTKKQTIQLEKYLKSKGRATGKNRFMYLRYALIEKIKKNLKLTKRSMA